MREKMLGICKKSSNFAVEKLLSYVNHSFYSISVLCVLLLERNIYPPLAEAKCSSTHLGHLRDGLFGSVRMSCPIFHGRAKRVGRVAMDDLFFSRISTLLHIHHSSDDESSAFPVVMHRAIGTSLDSADFGIFFSSRKRLAFTSNLHGRDCAICLCIRHNNAE